MVQMPKRFWALVLGIGLIGAGSAIVRYFS